MRPVQRQRSHVLSVGPNPHRFTMHGLSMRRGRPLLSLDAGARAVVSVQFDRVLAARDRIETVKLAASGVTALARFDERRVELEISGARAHAHTGYGGYGSCHGGEDFAEIQVATSDGETRVIRIVVQGFNRDRDWHQGAGGTDPRVADLRRQRVYGNGPAFPITALLFPGGAAPVKPLPQIIAGSGASETADDDLETSDEDD